MLILINERISLSYSKVTTALMNLDLRRKDNESFDDTSAEVLIVRGRVQTKEEKFKIDQRRVSQDKSKSKSKFGNSELG